MKSIAPHEPEEELLSVDEAFADAQNSESRWQVFDIEHGLKRVFIELPQPLYEALERLAHQRRQNVPVFIERVMRDLMTAFAPMN